MGQSPDPISIRLTPSQATPTPKGEGKREEKGEEREKRKRWGGGIDCSLKKMGCIVFFFIHVSRRLHCMVVIQLV